MNKIQTPFGILEIDDTVEPTSNIKLSRLYGFSLDVRGNVVSVPEEQDIIREVIETIALSPNSLVTTIADLTDGFAERALRNRSSKRWIPKTIAGLVRPIYGSKIETSFGYAKAVNYRAIVPWETVARALAVLETGRNSELWGRSLNRHVKADN